MNSIAFLPVTLLTLAAASTSIAADKATARTNRIDARMMRYADVSATQIAFVYAGDIWVAPRSGGVSTRLSSPRGEESFPRFSPDGSLIAFSGNYDGNLDIYVVPSTGGLPRRITHHGAPDRVLGWYPDGKHILYATSMTSQKDRFNQLYRVSLEGGHPEKLPVPYGEFGSISPDGKTLAFTTISVDFRTWKRYRGGMNPDIWLFDLEKLLAKNVTKNDANDAQPMWHGDTMYFLSDRDGAKRANIWAYDTKKNKFRQVTEFKDYDVHFPSVGPDDLIFEHGGRLYLLDLATEKHHAVDIQVVTDLATLKPRVEKVTSLIQSASVSPSGKRALFESRGEIFSAPAEHGVIRNVTRTSGVAERYPGWSPDGTLVAFFSDKTGEYELTIRNAEGAGEEQTLTKLGAGYRYKLHWSPDSKKIVFIDQAMKVHLHDLDTKETKEIDHQLWMYHGDLNGFTVSWSEDSRWLAYQGDLENQHTAIVLYDTKDGERHQVTSGFYNDEAPVFDPDGKYLYLRTDRTFNPTYSEHDWAFIYANSQNLAAVPLRKDVASPLAPRNEEESDKDKKDKADEKKKEDEKPDEKKEDKKPDKKSIVQARADRLLTPAFSSVEEEREDQTGGASSSAFSRQSLTTAVPAPLNGERVRVRGDNTGPAASVEDKKEDEKKPAEEKKDEAKSEDKKDEKKEDKKKDDKPKPVEIDIEGFEQRMVILPPKAGRYANLQAVSGKLLYRRLPRVGSSDEKNPIVFYDLEKREEKTVLDNADGFQVSAKRDKMLAWNDGTYSIIEPKESQKMEKKIDTGSFEATIDPVAEWRQIFSDAWRLQRDYFYDPAMHGVNWGEMRERYGKLLADAVTRWDVNYVIGELISELNASHTYRSGGDIENPPSRGVGYLGCDFSLENGAYRIKKIVDPAPWDSEVRSPLHRPGITNVSEGDYVLAVNGAPIDTTQDPWAAFQGLADKPVLLTVNDQPAMDGAREVLVQTLGSEARLRHLAWINENRRKVEEASDGKIGYVYVPDTGQNGQNELVRQWRGQIDKAGLIIDERFNSGGQIPDRFVELLGRPLRNSWGVRDGQDWTWPPIAHFGPKAMLINGWSGSGGDCFPFYFKQAKLGPLIGMRTWGGLIGITGAPPLIDGGNVTVPTFGIYDPKGEWIIEGYGVDPDIEVVDDPGEMAKGGDPQLERAIKEVLKEIKQHPPQKPKKPKYPNRAG
jgi:tricorn protease